MTKRVLCLLAPGFEEIEAVTPADLLRRAGAEVTLAALDDGRLVRGRSGITVEADAVLEEVMEQPFDLLLIPGGPGVKTLRADGRAARLAVEWMRSGRMLAAICAAPLVLKDAGLLEQRRYTAHFSIQAELAGALMEERVVEDGPVITSRGAGTALEFGLTLVRRLCGEDKAREVARSIMA